MDGHGLIDAIAKSAVLIDKAGRVLNWNQAATDFFGYAKKEIIGKSVNLIYQHNYPFPKIIQDFQKAQMTWHADTPFVKKNGSKGICKTQLLLLEQTIHEKIAAILMHHEVAGDFGQEYTIPSFNQTIDYACTYQVLNKMANTIEGLEKKLRESELRFHLLAENATDIISRHLPDGTFLYSSPASRATLGYLPEHLVGKNIYTLIHHDDLHKVKKAFTRHKVHSVNPIIYRIKRKEGEFRWFESNIRIIMDEKTNLTNEIQLASRDVTARVMDKKARLRGQQLARVYRLSTMEEMASGMAHEISQPLAAIVNYTRGCVRHLQSQDYDRDQIKQVMQKAALQAERAGEIVQRLKNFFCKGQLLKTPCKINNMIRETVNLVKNELNASKTKVEFSFDRDIPIISIDKIQVQQVVLNLIQNAIESMQQHKTKDRRIHIQTKAVANETIEITLHDSGPGFTKEVINKVFMPFFTTKAHGRGMGLAICRSIIEAHGGQFTINPNLHQDSWIRFSLPLSI